MSCVIGLRSPIGRHHPCWNANNVPSNPLLWEFVWVPLLSLLWDKKTQWRQVHFAPSGVAPSCTKRLRPGSLNRMHRWKISPNFSCIKFFFFLGSPGPNWDTLAFPCLKQQKKAPCIKFLSRTSQSQCQGYPDVWVLMSQEYRERKFSPKISDRSFWKPLRVVDVRAFGSWMSAPKCLLFQDFQRPDRSFGPGCPREWPPDVRGMSVPNLFGLIFRSGEYPAPKLYP